MAMNLVELLGKIKRTNTDLSFYEDNPELFNLLGEKGVKLTEGNLLFDILNLFTPKSERGRMQTFGNQILIPTGEWDEKELIAQLLNTGGVPYEGIGEAGVFEELPHVQQFRDKGFLGMGLSGAEDMTKNFFEHLSEGDLKTAFNPVELQKTLYDTPGTEEEFHGDEEMKRDLINKFLGEGSYMDYRGWPYEDAEGEPMQYHVDRNLKLASEITPYPGYTYQGEEVIPPIDSFEGSKGVQRYDGDKGLLTSLGLDDEQLRSTFPDINWEEDIKAKNEAISKLYDSSTESNDWWDTDFPPDDINQDGAIDILDIMIQLQNQDNFTTPDIYNTSYKALDDGF